MGRTIELGALNIKMHPHTAEKYAQLFSEAKNNKKVVHYHGDRFAMLGFFNNHDLAEQKDVYQGLIYSFIHIDPKDPWFDTDTGEEADQETIEGISIPDRLKPGMRRFEFVFFANQHRIIFTSKNYEGHGLGPSSARKLFENLFNNQELFSKYGQVDVIVEPQTDAINAVLSVPNMEYLEIHITRPNPDDGAEQEKQVMERLAKMNARSHTEKYHAIKGCSLDIDNDVRSLAVIGSHNGYAASKGRDHKGKVVEESTREHHLKEKFHVNDVQFFFSEMLQKAKEIIENIKKG